MTVGVARGVMTRGAILLLWAGTSVLSRGQANGPSSAGLAVASDAKDDLEACRVHKAVGIPGSHLFPGDFIEAVATDPGPEARGEVIWGLTADLNSSLPSERQALYIAKSVDGGATWQEVARVSSRYFDASIGEGLRNGFIVAPGGAYFIVTTQRGAFQVFPEKDGVVGVVRAIEGPRVPATPPKIPITKKSGEPVRGNIVAMTEDGGRLILGYGYFDLDPQLFFYRRDASDGWVMERSFPHIPTEMDLLSVQFDDAKNSNPNFIYVGTGDQVYMFNLRSKRWSMVDGVGPDSAIHGMTAVNGLHIAACWGVYNPVGPGMVRRVTNAKFLLHPTSDEAGSNLRAYSIEVDPLRPTREIVTSITGVYRSRDGGATWVRLNDLPDGEYRTAHFNPDGSVLISGMPGTFLVNPFSAACTPQLQRRKKASAGGAPAAAK